MFKSASKSNLEGEFQCKISLLDDTELSCDFKVSLSLALHRPHASFTNVWAAKYERMLRDLSFFV